MTAPAIILQDVSVKQYGKEILKNISFKLSANEHLALGGETGSGKTSLAKAIAGYLFHTGKIDIILSTSNIKSKIVFVEYTEQYKNLSNVADFYYQQRFNSCDTLDAKTLKEEIDRIQADTLQVNQLLEQFNLLHRTNATLIQLSNGEQKKLQLIKALLQQPQVLILDKAFTGLDIDSRKELHAIVNEIASKGTTILLITDEKEIPCCITHIAELKEGSLIQFNQKNLFQFNTIQKISFNKQVPVIQSQQVFEHIVEMKEVYVQYGTKTILDNINWTVKYKEHWLVKGPNGAGKSTLLSLITADNPQAYANEIYLFDKRRGKGESIWDIKAKTGFVSPELHKYFDKGITIYQTIACGFFDTMGLYKKLSAQQEHQLAKWIDFFGLVQIQHKTLAAVSTGEQRIALLARAFVKNPPLLVLDEPCQHLDTQQVQHFIQLVDQICDQTNTTLIYVSHYANEIPRCINKVLELNNGKQIIHHTKEIKAA